MADMQRPPAGGRPMDRSGPNPGMGVGAGGPPQGNPIERNKSIFNPTDAASMLSSGQINKDMTVKDLIENVFKVPITAPASALVQALRKQAENRTVLGKTQNMAGQARPGAPPQGPPQGSAPRPAPQRQGLDDLIGQR